jgi:hypothetical protein
MIVAHCRECGYLDNSAYPCKHGITLDSTMVRTVSNDQAIAEQLHGFNVHLDEEEVFLIMEGLNGIQLDARVDALAGKLMGLIAHRHSERQIELFEEGEKRLIAAIKDERD